MPPDYEKLINTRPPPHSVEAEKAVLGSALMDCYRVIPLMRGTYKLKPEMFFVEHHRKLCAFLYEEFEAGRLIDLLVISQTLRDRGMIDQVGGNRYLEELVDAVGTSAHAEYYCEIVRSKFLIREVVRCSQELIAEAYFCEQGDKLVLLGSEAFSLMVSDVTRERSNEELIGELQAGWQAAHDAFYNHKPVPMVGLSAPWEDVDELIGGYEPGLHLLAGRPSAGKTSLEGSIASYWCSEGIPVARATLDISRKRLLMRDACRMAGVSAPKLKHGFATKADLARINEAKKIIGTWPMHITELREIGAICSYFRAQKMRNKIRAATLDHATLPEIASAGKGWDIRRQVKYITSTLKACALELDIPILLLSQLSRGIEKDSKKPRPPRLSDLKESGSLEEDATTVTFVYKTCDEDELRTETKQRRPVIMEIAKHQDGETGFLEFWLRPAYFRFDRARPMFADPPPDSPIDPNRPEPLKQRELQI